MLCWTVQDNAGILVTWFAGCSRPHPRVLLKEFASATLSPHESFICDGSKLMSLSVAKKIALTFIARSGYVVLKQSDHQRLNAGIYREWLNAEIQRVQNEAFAETSRWES